MIKICIAWPNCRAGFATGVAIPQESQRIACSGNEIALYRRKKYKSVL